MFRQIRSTQILIIIILGMVSCTSADHRVIEISEENTGETINMQVGDILKVTLEGNPTTGYGWVVVSTDKQILKQVGDEEFEPASGALGSSGKISLFFGAMSKGRQELKLIYKRPWEVGVAPIAMFEVTVIVE